MKIPKNFAARCFTSRNKPDMEKKDTKPGAIVERPILGRISSHLKMGIVGLPNVGKSSLFNLMTKCEAKAENFPFCTIDPNVARVPLPDDRFNWLCEHYNPKSKVPSALEVVDIAGLVPGAHEGAGLGNAFLSHIGHVDGIYHVVRVFADPDIIHTEVYFLSHQTKLKSFIHFFRVN
jgi:obg-like ATPase 1